MLKSLTLFPPAYVNKGTGQGGKKFDSFAAQNELKALALESIHLKAAKLMDSLQNDARPLVLWAMGAVVRSLNAGLQA